MNKDSICCLIASVKIPNFINELYNGPCCPKRYDVEFLWLQISNRGRASMIQPSHWELSTLDTLSESKTVRKSFYFFRRKRQ